MTVKVYVCCLGLVLFCLPFVTVLNFDFCAIVVEQVSVVVGGSMTTFTCVFRLLEYFNLRQFLERPLRGNVVRWNVFLLVNITWAPIRSVR